MKDVSQKRFKSFFQGDKINLSLKKDENELNIEIYELDDKKIILICGIPYHSKFHSIIYESINLM